MWPGVCCMLYDCNQHLYSGLYGFKSRVMRSRRVVGYWSGSGSSTCSGCGISCSWDPYPYTKIRIFLGICICYRAVSGSASQFGDLFIEVSASVQLYCLNSNADSASPTRLIRYLIRLERGEHICSESPTPPPPAPPPQTFNFHQGIARYPVYLANILYLQR